MKKTLIAVAALSAMAASAMAAQVTLYGKIDQGFQVQKTKVTGSESSTTFKGTSGISSGSRWGLKGTEELADGYTVGFVFESKIESMTGEGDSSRLFNRDAYLSLDTPFGQLVVGRTGMLSDGCTGDIISGFASPFGTSYGLAASTKNTFSDMLGGRTDRAIRYVSPKFAGFKVHAEFANMNAGDDMSSKQRYGGVGVSYANGPLYIAIAGETIRGSADQQKLYDNPKFLSLAANYDFGVAKVFAGYQYAKDAPVNATIKGTTVTNKSAYGTTINKVGKNDGFAFVGKYNAGTLGVSAPIGNGTLMASVAYRKGTYQWKDMPEIDVKWMTGALGYKYNLSKRTYLYTDIAYGKEEWKYQSLKQSGKVTEFNAGICHNF